MDPNGAVRLGRFHGQTLLGRGPAAETWRARLYGLAGLDRAFAVKRLRPELAEATGLAARFAEAARLYAALSAPGIGRVVEVAADGSVPFVVSELVHGVDLRELGEALRASGGGRLEPALVVHLGVQIADALAAAHAAAEPVVHGGLGTGNVIVTPAGGVRILDFGVSASVRHGAPADVERARYLAPEVLAGNNPEPRSDLYSLGALLYELCLGSPPFVGDSVAEILERARQGPPTLPGIPHPLGPFIGSLVSPRIEDRPASAELVARRLDEAALGMGPADPRRPLAAIVRRARSRSSTVPIAPEAETIAFATALDGSARTEPTDGGSAAGAAQDEVPAEYVSRELIVEMDPDTPAPIVGPGSWRPIGTYMFVAPTADGQPPPPPVEQLVRRGKLTPAGMPAVVRPPPAPPPSEVVFSLSLRRIRIGVGAAVALGVVAAVAAALSGKPAREPEQVAPRARVAARTEPAVHAPGAAPAPSLAASPAPSPAPSPAASPASSPAPSPASGTPPVLGEWEPRRPPTPPPSPAPAASPAPASAPQPVAETAKPGHLGLITDPPGAVVWVAGQERGHTPAEVEVGPGRFRIILVMPGYGIVDETADATKGAVLNRKLRPVLPPAGGRAGIKVRCKTEDRFPVLVDGKETGLICPTERIGVEPGSHEVAILVPSDGKLYIQRGEFDESSASTRVRFKN